MLIVSKLLDNLALQAQQNRVSTLYTPFISSHCRAEDSDSASFFLVGNSTPALKAYFSAISIAGLGIREDTRRMESYLGRHLAIQRRNATDGYQRLRPIITSQPLRRSFRSRYQNAAKES